MYQLCPVFGFYLKKKTCLTFPGDGKILETKTLNSRAKICDMFVY
jgi:hypothetical protein